MIMAAAAAGPIVYGPAENTYLLHRRGAEHSLPYGQTSVTLKARPHHYRTGNECASLKVIIIMVLYFIIYGNYGQDRNNKLFQIMITT